MVHMDLTCRAEYVITYQDGRKERFNGGPANDTPEGWRELRDTLRGMTPEEAGALLKTNGWTTCEA